MDENVKDEALKPEDYKNPNPPIQKDELEEIVDQIEDDIAKDDKFQVDPATIEETDDPNQIDSRSTAKSQYSEQQMMEALTDHAEEIKNILADIDNQEAQRAGLDLLFGEDYEGEMTEICKDGIALNFP